MSEETVRILREARALVEKPGVWAQGLATETPGRHCIVTALWVVDHDLLAYARAKDAIRAAIGITGMISPWNDAPGRTQAEVLAAFDKAIALAEAAP